VKRRTGLRPKQAESLTQRVNALEKVAKKLHLNEAAHYWQSTGRLLWRSFLAGIARGFGIFLGFSILAALITLVLTTALRDNWPKIAAWLDTMLENLQKRL